jgi:hypothetical protein
MRTLPKFQPSAELPNLIPGLALAPLYKGAAIWNVFSTGGQTDPSKWRHGRFGGCGVFESLDDAEAVAAFENATLARHADYVVICGNAGLFAQTGA